MEDNTITATQARQETNAAIKNEVSFHMKAIVADIHKHAQKGGSFTIVQVNAKAVRRIIVQILKQNGFRIGKMSDQPGGFSINW